jgi:hypothetical protein
MGLNIRIYNIDCPNDFRLSYRIAPTPGDETVILSGYITYTGDTSTGIYPKSTTRNYYDNPIILSGTTFDNIFFDTLWVKIQDTITGGYIIENIKIHSENYFSNCVPTSTPVPTATNTPTATPTPTPTPSSTPGPTSTPEPTATDGPTATPSSTPTPTPTATPTNTPTPSPTPTSTPTPTPTSTLGDGCVIVDFNFGSEIGLSDGCGGNGRTDTTIRAYFYDSFGGTPIPAPQTITITITGSTSDCLGTTLYSTQITINQGTTYTDFVYTSYSYEICPYDQQCTPYSLIIDGVSEITPSGITQCEVPTATPSPTPEPTPEETPLQEYWYYSDGEMEYGPYSSMSECQLFVNNPNGYVCYMGVPPS